MGLFSFFSKSPETHEKKGDAAYEQRAFGSAKLEYEKALEQSGDRQNDPQDPLTRRLREKLDLSRESLAAQHLDRAEELLENNSREDALTYLALAENLTLNQELREDLARRIAGLTTTPAGPVPFYGDDGDHPHEELPVQGSDLDEFYALIGALPDDIADEYADFGDAFIQGYLLLNQGGYQDALPLLEEAFQLQEGRVTHLHLELARTLIPLGHHERAETLINDFLDHDRNSMTAIALLCDLFWVQKRFMDAHGRLDSLPEKIRATPDFCRLKGWTLFMENRFEEAGTVYQEYLSTGDWHEPIARDLVTCLAAGGDIHGARRVLLTLLNTCTGCGRKPSAEDRLLYADLCIQMQDVSADTVDLLLSLAAEQPGLAAPYFERAAKIFRLMGNETEAVRYETLAGNIKES